MQNNIKIRKVSYIEKCMILLIILQFLFSISTSFIDTGIYNTVSIFILIFAVFFYFLWKGRLVVQKKIFS